LIDVPLLTDIVPLDTIHPDAVETLLDDAFGSDRHSRTAYRLRAGTRALPALSFAAIDGAQLVGSLQSWPVRLTSPEGEVHRLILVGPVAVSPDRQRSGIGRRLMEAMLAVADAGAADALMMIGDPEYYGRFFGFDAAPTQGWQIPGPVERHRLLARIRRPGGLSRDGAIGPDLSAQP
jgi:predicted N-acetyltransferase YhbS